MQGVKKGTGKEDREAVGGGKEARKRRGEVEWKGH